MAELVGGAVLSASLQVLFDRMASRGFMNLFSRRKNCDKLLKKLKLTLLTLQAMLNDAEDKQIIDQAVSDWLDELRDVIYRADDLLAEIDTAALRNKLEAESHCSPDQVSSNSIVSTSLYAFGDGMEARLEELIETLECFVKQKEILGLKGGVVSKQLKRPTATTSLVGDSGVYGRESDQEKIIELLLSDNGTGNRVCVIPIVGMGGVGKTTLAQLVFNDGRLDENFNFKVWVCVSEEFDVFAITKKIFYAVIQSTNKINDENLLQITLEKSHDLNLLQIKLKESLKGKKFLLVLDDVWNNSYNDWEILKRPFTVGPQGSRIIVTTRNHDVARVMGTVPSHLLKQLSFEDCWTVFAKHAFKDGNSSVWPKLEETGKEIVRKCKGLPLAVKTLGGLLCSKLDIEEWHNVLKSEIWDLPNDILPALRLSYQYLPSHLKRCFGYCSIFPKDYAFERENLIQLWIALDFVLRPKAEKLLEDEGNRYFNELLSRSFFERLGDKKNHFVMHDLVHDLAQFISGVFCFRLEGDNPIDISEKVRYFSYVARQYNMFKQFKEINELKHIRTFMSFNGFPQIKHLGPKVLNDILPGMRCLRVISLSDYFIFELPESIGNLIHLRYLDLSKTYIKRLPDSVTMLCNLQTLNLSHCHDLIELPWNMKNLINLHHVYITRTKLAKMPVQMSSLKDLQHLTDFVVGENGSGSGINELRELGLRGRLCISGLQNVINDRDAWEANMKDKKHLEGLWLCWSGITDDSQHERDVFDKLRPHESVNYLKITGYGGTRFPDWMGDHSFCYLKSVQLMGCANCWSLPPLGQLPSLKGLEIMGMNGIRQVGSEFYGNVSKPFQLLESLTFCGLLEWEEWSLLGAGLFSNIVDLSLIKCPKLTKDLSNYLFPSLKKLEVVGCPGIKLPPCFWNSHQQNSLRHWTDYY